MYILPVVFRRIKTAFRFCLYFSEIESDSILKAPVQIAIIRITSTALRRNRRSTDETVGKAKTSG